MNNEFNTILDYCIDEMRTGQSIDDLVNQFPEYADELRPMLEMSEHLGELEAPEPSAETINNALFEIGQRAGQQQQEPDTSGLFLPAFVRQPWVRRTVSAVLVVVVLFIGLSTASADSVPGDLLYPIKQLTESIQIAFTFNEEDAAELRLTFSEKRLEELSQVYRETGEVNEPLIQAMLADAGNAIERAMATGDTLSFLRTKAQHLNETQHEFLQHLQPRVRRQARQTVDRAIEICGQRRGRMQQMMQRMMDGDMPMHQGQGSGHMNGMMERQ
ncbi:MAG: DUF5667 domain-containing protein [Candidatus Marinimicrobia bacterium]|nr:DUF5667 domain-containing protein [Candidatus Neomarinimicrobiota bacterium]MCF7829282.1 DUF5667 domain-containing protein [Candidatus Neomarinimicrobiota bacterium]MCF7881065.1 DUF5667 domain-containing protein [Candidatus Neomarinimicrobiota bacterium]